MPTDSATAPPAPDRREIEVTAADGYRLGLTEHRGAHEPRAVVVVQGATAVPRPFYYRLADHLASRGFLALTFDYRGVGGSLHGPLRSVDATMTDWARLDAPAALAHAVALADGRPVQLFCHSFGGQALAIEPPSEPLAAAVLVACQEGDVRLWPWRWIPWFLFGVGFVIPVCVRLFGYVPRWAGFGDGLPGGVASEWARWCRHRGYVFGVHPELADRGEAVRCPILSLSFSDDHYAPYRAVEALLRRFPNAEIEHRHERPADLRFSSIGHFGFFRSRRSRLWDAATAWMEEATKGCKPSTA